MAIVELAVFPQYTLSTAQGFTGTRKWVLDADNDLKLFLDLLCNSYWPVMDRLIIGGQFENTVPTSIQVGPFDEKVYLKPGTDEEQPLPGELPLPLPKYGKTLVVANYQFLHFVDQWPASIPRPLCYPGTTLSLSIHGGGEAMLMPPTTMRAGDEPVGGVFHAQAGSQVASGPMDPRARVFIPRIEYHIINDRLLKWQLDALFQDRNWSTRTSTVNKTQFLGQPAETMLFDAWNLDHSFVPSTSDCTRFKLKCVIKSRRIPDPIYDPQYINPAGALGWNHDYQLGKGWTRISMVVDPANGILKPRYLIDDFDYIFIPHGFVFP